MTFLSGPRSAVALCLLLLASCLAGSAAAFRAPEGRPRESAPPATIGAAGDRTEATAAKRSAAEKLFAARFSTARSSVSSPAVLDRESWRVHSWNRWADTPHFAYGIGLDVPGASGPEPDLVAAALEVIRANPEFFRASPRDLRLDAVPEGPGKRSVLFQQSYHGLDVLGGQVRMVFTDAGRLFALGSDVFQDIRLETRPSVPAEVARQIARRSVSFHEDAGDSVEEAAKLLVLPVPSDGSTVEFRLVWRVRVHTTEPVGTWVTFVDAHEGGIVWQYNDVHSIDFTGDTAGMIERPSYCEGQESETLPYLRVWISGLSPVYADAQGNWNVPYNGTDSRAVNCDLYSPYVDLNNVGGAEAGFSAIATPGVPLTITFDDTNSQRDERDVYRAVNDIHDYFSTIQPNFDYTNSRINANVSRNETCNAYWNGSINFYIEGDGCANTGEIMGVVEHEYGHGITNAILGWQGTEGIGEGNSDVLANLMTRESMIGRGFHLGQCHSGIRNSENTLRYPDDVIGHEEHDAGQVIAGFHWDGIEGLIAQLGPDEGWHTAAMDWHFGRFLWHPTNQPDQVLATFIADDDDGDLTNGTPHYDALCQAAFNHGFDCPELTVGVFITHEPVSSRTSGGDVPIIARIQSTEGALVADSLRVNYRKNGGGFTSLQMAPTGTPNEYRATIGGLQKLDQVEYFIRARDVTGHTATSPPHAPAVLHAFDIATQFDDFEAPGGWTVNLGGTDTATSGIWEWGDPVGTWINEEPVQPEDDYTHSPGVNCWVTGNGTPGGPPEEDDVGGGFTSLTSPVYDVTSCDLATVKYRRWFTNNQGGNPGQDAWKVQVRNNEGNWQNLEYTVLSENSWSLKSFDLAALFGASIGQVQFRFIASDTGPVSLVEAGVDDFELLAMNVSGVPGPAPGPARYALVGSRPNPLSGGGEIAFEVPAASPVRLELFDVAGRLMRVLASGRYASGAHEVFWDGRDARGHAVAPGTYFCRMTATGFTATRRVVVR